MKTNEEIAKSAANDWCRCFKCDEMVHDIDPCYMCKKPNKTCQKWYDGYRTALIALEHKDHIRDTDLSLQVD